MITLPQVTDRERRALVFGTLVIVALLAGTRGLPAARTYLASTRAEATERREREAHEAWLAARSELIMTGRAEAAASRQASERRLIPAHSPAEGGAALAALLDRLALDARVQVTSSSVRSDSAFVNSYGYVSVRTFATADVHGLLALFRAIEEQPLLLAIREFVVTQPDPAADDLTPEALRVEYVVEGMVRRGTALASPTP